MSYTFSSLWPADFEDLARDLVGAELGRRFESFSAGPDGGIDGRHASAAGQTVLQAKHYAGSTFARLKMVMRKERRAIDKLAPARYILATSCSLSPKRKAALAAIIGPSLRSEEDIFGPRELNSLLRKHPQLERAHIKLWLASSVVLETLLRSALYAVTATAREEIEAKVRVYAANPSFDAAWRKLEANHVLIITGPPGVGKPTLAEMLASTYISENWEFVAIRSLEDGFAAISDHRK